MIVYKQIAPPFWLVWNLKLAVEMLAQGHLALANFQFLLGVNMQSIRGKGINGKYFVLKLSSKKLSFPLHNLQKSFYCIWL